MFLIMDTNLILSLYIQLLVVFVTHFDEGSISEQSRVAIDFLGAQNDGESVEEVDQEDEERLIYPSTLEDKLEGESDAERIVTT
jgi:hypothetical protein